jgi:hypothetical protein
MFRFKVDDKTFKQLESALKDLPEEMRRKPVQEAFMKAAQELKKEAVSIGNQVANSGSWAKAQQVVRGRKQQFGPYAVVRTANRKFSITKRAPHMSQAAPAIANPNKYNHLLQQGSKGGLRIGGLGKTTGTKRPRPLAFGSSGGRRLTGKGGFVVKNAKTGYLHRIAGIKHPGFGGHDIYGQVMDKKTDAAVNRFEQQFIPILDKFKRKHGFA